MWWKELKKYLGLFLTGAILIAVYKTFDNFGHVIDWCKNLLSLLTPFVIGGCIAYLLYIPCRRIEGFCEKTKVAFIKNHRRGLAIALIYLVFFAVVVLLMVAIIPALTRSIKDFVDQLPSIIQGLFTWLNSFDVYEFNSASVMRFVNEHILSMENLLGSFSFDNVNRYAKGVMSVGTSVFNAFMGIIISVYILLDRKKLKAGFSRIVSCVIPQKRRDTLGWYLGKANEFIHRYISCQLLDALIVFVLSFIALALLRAEYAILLAVIMGLFNLIPYFGAIVATVLAAVITAFTQGFTAGLIVAIVLIILQQIDTNLIQPRLVADSLDLAPFWVILAIVLGGGLFGVLGIFLAVPMFAFLRILLLDVMERREEKMKEKSRTEPKLS